MLGDSDARRDDPRSGQQIEGAEEPHSPHGKHEPHEQAEQHGESSDVPTPPVTGDEAVDEAMRRLAQSQAGSFAERIESGEQAHHSLQSRLGGLGGA